MTAFTRALKILESRGWQWLEMFPAEKVAFLIRNGEHGYLKGETFTIVTPPIRIQRKFNVESHYRQQARFESEFFKACEEITKTYVTLGGL
jgi:hypothetical protein